MQWSPALGESEPRAGWSKRGPHTWGGHMFQVAQLGLGGDSVGEFCGLAALVSGRQLCSSDFLHGVLVQDQPFVSDDDWWGFVF